MICWRSIEFIPSKMQIVTHSNSLKHNPQNTSKLVSEKHDFIKKWTGRRTITTFPIGRKIVLKYSLNENFMYGNTIHIRAIWAMNSIHR